MLRWVVFLDDLGGNNIVTMVFKRGTQEESVKSQVTVGPEVVVMCFEDAEQATAQEYRQSLEAENGATKEFPVLVLRRNQLCQQLHFNQE